MKLRLRFNFKTVVVFLLVIFASAAFVFTGFGRLHFSGGLDPNTVAIVGQEKVTVQEFRSALQDQRRMMGQMGEEQEKMLEQYLLNHLIKRKIIVEATHGLGWEPTEEEIALWIRTLPEFSNQKTGKFDVSIYKKFLARGHFSELSLFGIAKDSLSRQKFETLASVPVATPQGLLHDIYRRDNTTFTIEYALINPSQVELEKALEIAIKEYLANTDNVKNLEKTYETSPEFQGETVYDLDSLLVGYQGTIKANTKSQRRTKEDALILANDLIKKFQGGMSFEELSNTHNDDFKSKSQKGRLGEVTKNQLDPDSFQAISLLSTGQSLTLAPVDTPHGFRLYRLNKMIQKERHPFDKVKELLAKRVIEKSVETQLQNALEVTLQDLLTKGKISSSELTNKFHLTWEKVVKPIKVSSNSIDKLGVSENLSSFLFKMKRPGDLVPTPVSFGSKKALIRLVKVTYPPQPTQEEIQSLQTRRSMSFSYAFTGLFEKYQFEKMQKDGKIEINSLFKNLK